MLVAARQDSTPHGPTLPRHARRPRRRLFARFDSPRFTRHHRGTFGHLSLHAGRHLSPVRTQLVSIDGRYSYLWLRPGGRFAELLVQGYAFEDGVFPVPFTIGTVDIEFFGEVIELWFRPRPASEVAALRQDIEAWRGGGA